MNEIKVFINRNGILSKYLTDTIDFNKHGRKGTQCGTVLPEMLTKLFVRSYFQHNELFIYFFSFL
jgi:hypothetical protein